MAIEEAVGLETGWHNVAGGNYYALDGPRPETIFFAGLGDGREAVERTVKYLASYGFITAGIVPEFPGADQNAIEETLKSVMPATVRDLNTKSGNDIEAPMDVAGYSAGGGEALYSFWLCIRDNTSILNNLIIVNSVGPSNWAFARKPASIFNKRRKTQTIPLLPNMAVENADRPALDRLLFALSKDNCPEILKDIADDDHQVVVGFSVYDTVFKPDEGKLGLASLKAHRNVHIIDLPGRHASLSQMAGRLQLKQALGWLNP